MIVIPNMDKPKRCIEEWDFGLMGNPCKFLETDMSCILQPESEPFDCGENYNTCPLIDIVTCGECKYMRKYALRSDEPTGIWCHRWSIPRLITDDDFCSYGERKPISDERLEFWEKVYKEASK